MNPKSISPVLDLGRKTLVERIVIPVSLDHRFDRGVAVASQLADRWRLPVHLVSVRSPATGDLDATKEQLDERERLLRIGWPWLDIDDEAMESGDDPAAIVAASFRSSDLVVLATQSVGSNDWASSFAQTLAIHWDGPIVMVGPLARINTTDGDVVIGLDGSARAEHAMPAAVGLSIALASHSWVVQVVPTSPAAQPTPEAGPDDIREDGYVNDVVERLGRGRATGVVLHGDNAAAALVRFADDHRAAFHVMITRGESGSVGSRFGSVCMGTVRRAHCPVLVIRPESGV